jgi:hypothetical protein
MKTKIQEIMKHMSILRSFLGGLVGGLLVVLAIFVTKEF